MKPVKAVVKSITVSRNVTEVYNYFENVKTCDDIFYCKAKEDSYDAITKDGWYIRDAQYNRPIASLEPFRYCPWCSKKLAKPTADSSNPILTF
jgi:hypothetical protein